MIVREQFNKRIARVLIGKLEGAAEKQVNELLSNPTTKAKLMLAIEHIISLED